MTMGVRRFWLFGSAVVFIMATAFWFPALAEHKTIIHGDFTICDVPLADLQMRALKGRASLFWVDSIYGGHPLFAEGQGAFAHPLNIFWAAVVTPVIGAVPAANLIHWLFMIFGGVGMLGLCRSLGASGWASIFAMLAVIFSQAWTTVQEILSVSDTIAWIPWALWALEALLKRPTLKSAALLGVVSALIILGGYPQGFHSTVVYMATTLLVLPFQRSGVPTPGGYWKNLAIMLAISGAICLGLAAVQLLPLFELVRFSVRKAGTNLLFSVPLESYVRDFLFSVGGTGSGSFFVCIVAAFGLIVRTPPRIKGHFLATILMLQLGVGRGSPFFRFIYDHNLLPGLRYFRVTDLYLDIAIIGIAVLAAFAIDGIADLSIRFTRESGLRARRHMWLMGASIFIFALFIWMLVISVHFDRTLMDISMARPGILQIIVSIVGFVVAILLILVRKSHLLAPFLVVVLAAECATVRLHLFQFFDYSLIEQQPNAALIKQTPGWRDFKLHDGSMAMAAGFTLPWAPEVEPRIRRMVASLPSMLTATEGLPSIDGSFSLPLARRAAIASTIDDEVAGRTASPPGLRLIDLLGIRFVTLDTLPAGAAFRTLKQDEANHLWITENTAALPRFQIYTHAQSADSVEAALAAVKSLKTKTLILENAPDLADARETDAADPASAAQIDVFKANATKYRFRISARSAVWLFVADANYPGWTARVDGQSVPIFSAQVLGKAVAVPAGDHEVVLTFISRSFEWGLGISVLSIAGVIIILARRVGSGKTHAAHV